MTTGREKQKDEREEKLSSPLSTIHHLHALSFFLLFLPYSLSILADGMQLTILGTRRR
jgi:hypothetical protein